VAVLLTTHLMQEAEALADDVVIVDHGKVVASGSPDELTASVSGAEQRLRFRAVPGMDLRLLEGVLPEGHAGSEGPPGHYTVEGTIDPQVLAAVTAWCARQGVLADDVRVGRRSLEDVFLDLTGRDLRP
jgi:ABC-2 type transport system ATP-binding protein